MDKYAVPVTGWVSDDGDITPEVRIINASSPEEALTKCRRLLHVEEVAKNLKAGDSPGEAQHGGWANMIWYKDEMGEEEGWIMGDPVKMGDV